MKGKRKKGRGPGKVVGQQRKVLIVDENQSNKFGEPGKVVGQQRKEELSYDPHLKTTILEVVENQIRDGEPPETRQTFERLVAAGYAEDQAKEMIGSVVVEDIWGMLHEGRAFDRERFAGLLERLG